MKNIIIVLISFLLMLTGFRTAVYAEDAESNEEDVSLEMNDQTETADSIEYTDNKIWNDELVSADDEISLRRAEIQASNEETIASYLMNSMGLNSGAASGVLANIYRESGFNPNATGDGGTSYGICQWHEGRWGRLKTYCSDNGYNWQTLNGQLHYLEHELKNYYPATYDFINHVSNTDVGGYLVAAFWCKHFEIPANMDSEISLRQGYVRNTYWPRYGNGTSVSMSADNPWYYYSDRPGRTLNS